MSHTFRAARSTNRTPKNKLIDVLVIFVALERLRGWRQRVRSTLFPLNWSVQLRTGRTGRNRTDNVDFRGQCEPVWSPRDNQKIETSPLLPSPGASSHCRPGPEDIYKPAGLEWLVGLVDFGKCQAPVVSWIEPGTQGRWLCVLHFPESKTAIIRGLCLVCGMG
jgi:hypothetical protein